MRYYEPGEKVIVKPNLELGKFYNGLEFTDNMKDLKVVTIIDYNKTYDYYRVAETSGVFNEEMLTDNFCVKGCKTLQNYIISHSKVLKGDQPNKYYNFKENEWGCSIWKREELTELTESQFNEYKNLKTPISYKLIQSLPDIQKGTIGKIDDGSVYFNSESKTEGDTYYSLGFIKENPNWFQPIYKSLPKINGYEAIIISFKKIKYGCIEIDLGYLYDLYNSSKYSFSDITVKEIKLSSRIVITMEQIEQILNYFN